MASRPKQAAPRPAPRLYLVTPQLADPSAFARQLTAALDAGDVAAVLLRLADIDERTMINCAKALATSVQSKDAALLLDGRPDLVARAGADGAHLTGLAALANSVGDLKPERIVGVGGLATRHDAMLAAEQGADYVMFGEPSLARTPGARGNRGTGSLVGGGLRGSVRRVCGVSRRSPAIGNSRSRFHRARRFSLA